MMETEKTEVDIHRTNASMLSTPKLFSHFDVCNSLSFLSQIQILLVEISGGKKKKLLTF